MKAATSTRLIVVLPVIGSRSREAEETLVAAGDPLGSLPAEAPAEQAALTAVRL
ncbi:hypothetical protein [Streptomyces ipomoeae]|uniref:hypothetical protein n=1 Tax=Streptomyces ipomoeae TaxID=103232 RepID=UPI0015F0C650|nr:hypothetical protein [Streptomyces ipomoeae]MDX2938384.1 hypothetical protein [Streptomyces ipomoeae]